MAYCGISCQLQDNEHLKGCIYQKRIEYNGFSGFSRIDHVYDYVWKNTKVVMLTHEMIDDLIDARKLTNGVYQTSKIYPLGELPIRIGIPETTERTDEFMCIYVKREGEVSRDSILCLKSYVTMCCPRFSTDNFCTEGREFHSDIFYFRAFCESEIRGAIDVFASQICRGASTHIDSILGLMMMTTYDRLLIEGLNLGLKCTTKWPNHHTDNMPYPLVGWLVGWFTSEYY